MTYLLLCKWSRTALALLLLVVGMYGWMCFKHFESRIMPVVKNFEIQSIMSDDTTLFISGVMTKSRDCRFESVTIYDNALRPPKLLDVKFLDTPSSTPSREEGFQAWGYWAITPKSKNIIITARHTCATGTVKTVLFDGVL